MKLTPNWMFVHLVILAALTCTLLYCIIGLLFDFTRFVFGDF